MKKSQPIFPPAWTVFSLICTHSPPLSHESLSPCLHELCDLPIPWWSIFFFFSLKSWHIRFRKISHLFFPELRLWIDYIFKLQCITWLIFFFERVKVVATVSEDAVGRLMLWAVTLFFFINHLKNLLRSESLRVLWIVKMIGFCSTSDFFTLGWRLDEAACCNFFTYCLFFVLVSHEAESYLKKGKIFLLSTPFFCKIVEVPSCG